MSNERFGGNILRRVLERTGLRLAVQSTPAPKAEPGAGSGIGHILARYTQAGQNWLQTRPFTASPVLNRYAHFSNTISPLQRVWYMLRRPNQAQNQSRNNGLARSFAGNNPNYGPTDNYSPDQEGYFDPASPPEYLQYPAFAAPYDNSYNDQYNGLNGGENDSAFYSESHMRTDAFEPPMGQLPAYPNYGLNPDNRAASPFAPEPMTFRHSRPTSVTPAVSSNSPAITRTFANGFLPPETGGFGEIPGNSPANYPNPALAAGNFPFNDPQAFDLTRPNIGVLSPEMAAWQGVAAPMGQNFSAAPKSNESEVVHPGEIAPTSPVFRQPMETALARTPSPAQNRRHVVDNMNQSGQYLGTIAPAQTENSEAKVYQAENQPTALNRVMARLEAAYDGKAVSASPSLAASPRPENGLSPLDMAYSAPALLWQKASSYHPQEIKPAEASVARTVSPNQTEMDFEGAYQSKIENNNSGEYRPALPLVHTPARLPFGDEPGAETQDAATLAATPFVNRVFGSVTPGLQAGLMRQPTNPFAAKPGPEIVGSQVANSATSPVIARAAIVAAGPLPGLANHLVNKPPIIPEAARSNLSATQAAQEAASEWQGLEAAEPAVFPLSRLATTESDLNYSNPTDQDSDTADGAIFATTPTPGMLHPAAIQRKATQTAPPAAVKLTHGGIKVADKVLRTSVGQPLNSQIQTRMSRMFGVNFEHVRVHHDEPAASYAAEIGAEAFTVGQKIFFGANRYQPDSPTGQALIGHELTHVVQQASLPSLGAGRTMEGSAQGQAMEQQAVQNERLILQHLSTAPASAAGAGSINRSLAPEIANSAGLVERNFAPLEPVHFQPENTVARAIESSSLVERFGLSGGNGNAGNSNAGASSNNGAAGANAGNQAEAAGGEQDGQSKEEQVEEMARKVYQLLKEQLIIERERSGAPGRPYF